MRAEKLELQNAELLFGLELSHYPALTDIESETKKLGAIYQCYIDFKSFEESLASQKWTDLDVPALKEGIILFERRCRNFESERSTPTFKALDEYVMNFKDAIPLIVNLKNDAVVLRHWEKLAHLTKTTNQMEQSQGQESFTLGNVFHMGLHKYPSEVEAIVNEAMQENRIEMFMKEIEDFWMACQLQIQVYKSDAEGIFILKSADDIMIQLEDHLLNLQAMGGSRYAAIFSENIKKWEKQLNLVVECLEVWFVVQCKWMYLEGIFVGAEDIRMQLPEESKKFDTVSKVFRGIMKAAKSNSIVIECCCADKRLDVLTELNTSLENCQKVRILV